MLLPLKLICTEKDVRKDGTSLIYIQYCYSSERRTNLNTQIAIPPAYWNENKLCVSEKLPVVYGNSSEINDDLLRMMRLAEDIVTFAQKQNIPDKGVFVKNAFKPNFDIQRLATADKTAVIAVNTIAKQLDFFGHWDDYIESKRKNVSLGMLRAYNVVKERLLSFEKHRRKAITFEALDFNFYDSLLTYLTYHHVHHRRKEKFVGLKLSSIGCTIKHLRTFVKDRVRRKLILPVDLTDFKILDEESDAVYLNKEEITAIYNLDLSEMSYLEPYRSLLVLACMTGLRFSDFSILNFRDLRKGLLHKKQEKSNHWVVIPLRKEAKDVFLRIFKEGTPDVTNPEFNRHIKTLGRIAGIVDLIEFSHKKGNKTVKEVRPKYGWITSHTGRRSFCTNEFLAGTPVKLIMQISGHKTEKDFYRYIRISPEDAARKMVQLWMERGDMDVLDNPIREIAMV